MIALGGEDKVVEIYGKVENENEFYFESLQSLYGHSFRIKSITKMNCDKPLPIIFSASSDGKKKIFNFFLTFFFIFLILFFFFFHFYFFNYFGKVLFWDGILMALRRNLMKIVWFLLLKLTTESYLFLVLLFLKKIIPPKKEK